MLRSLTSVESRSESFKSISRINNGYGRGSSNGGGSGSKIVDGALQDSIRIGELQRYEIIRNFFRNQSQSRLQAQAQSPSLRSRQRSNNLLDHPFVRSSSLSSSTLNRSNDYNQSRGFSCSSFLGQGKKQGGDEREDQDRNDGVRKVESESQSKSESYRSVEAGENRSEIEKRSEGNQRFDSSSSRREIRPEAGETETGKGFNPSKPYHNYPRSLRELALRAFNSNPNKLQNQIQNHLNNTSNQQTESQKDSSSFSKNQSSSSSSSRETSFPSSPINLSSSSSSNSSWARPTKEDLLNLAHGFWTRARIRFKWFTIRGFRRFNVDDLSAFFTLGGLGTILFVVIGTTTAVSVVFAGLNLLNMQEWIARKLADYLTSETGVTVVFESAIVPKWKDSRISFKNVFISRRAHGGDIDSLLKERRALAKKNDSLISNDSSETNFNLNSNSNSSNWSISNLLPFWNRKEEENQENHSSGDSISKRTDKKRRNWRTAATAGQGMSWEGTHYEEEEEVAPPMSQDSMGNFEDLANGYDDDPDLKSQLNNNFTMFDLNVDSIDVTLSFKRWWNGMGIIEDAVIKGVRGIVDRRNVFWDPSKPYDPRAHRRSPRHGDFHLESLVVEDFLVTVYQPGDFRPFNFSIFQASIPRFRKQWLFYDLLCADSITGQVDGCLMSLHKPQTIGRTNEAEQERESRRGSRWRTMSRFRVDGVNIDHVQNQSDLTGPLSWILSSRFDVVADIKFPKELSDDVDINTIIFEIVDNLTIAVSGDPFPLNNEEGEEEGPIPGQSRLSGPAIEAPVTTVGPGADRAREAKLREKVLQEEKFKEENDWREQRRRRWKERMRKIRERRNGFSRSLEEQITGDQDQEPDRNPEENLKVDGNDGNEYEKENHVKASLPVPTPSVVIDMDVRFKDTKAAVPLFTRDISYKNNAFVRPIVAFMNAHKTLIPVHCRIVMDLSEFDGSIDLGQTGLLPLVSEKIHEALANHVASQNANQQRLKNVSLWSLQKVANAALRFLRSNIQNTHSSTTTSDS